MVAPIVRESNRAVDRTPGVAACPALHCKQSVRPVIESRARGHHIGRDVVHWEAKMIGPTPRSPRNVSAARSNTIPRGLCEFTP